MLTACVCAVVLAILTSCRFIILILEFKLQESDTCSLFLYQGVRAGRGTVRYFESPFTQGGSKIIKLTLMLSSSFNSQNKIQNSAGE